MMRLLGNPVVVLLTLAGAALSARAQYPDPAKCPMRGADPTPSTPEAFAGHLSAELQRWTAVVYHTALKVQ